jgi:hypothetical protein
VELASRYHPGAQSFEAATRFFENLCTPTLTYFCTFKVIHQLLKFITKKKKNTLLLWSLVFYVYIQFLEVNSHFNSVMQIDLLLFTDFRNTVDHDLLTLSHTHTAAEPPMSSLLVLAFCQ